MSYRSVILADNPALYRRHGESSGSIAADQTANGRDGAIVGAITKGAA